MKRAEWRKELGELVRDAMRSPESWIIISK